MTVLTIFDSCRPRPDVLAGAVAEADFAADLAQVIVGKGRDDYVDPARLLRQHLSDEGPREPAGECLWPAERRGRRSGLDLPPRHLLRWGKVARFDRAVSRRTQRGPMSRGFRSLWILRFCRGAASA